MKKYYKLKITPKEGKVYTNPLTLTEMPRIIAGIVKENKSVEISVDVMTKERYNLTFGISPPHLPLLSRLLKTNQYENLPRTRKT